MRVGTFELQEKQNGWMVVERIDVPHHRFPRDHTHNYGREGSRSDAMAENEAPNANARRLVPCRKMHDANIRRVVRSVTRTKRPNLPAATKRPTDSYTTCPARHQP